eukprot:972966-Pelagomonas_calceolata.AAC.2
MQPELLGTMCTSLGRSQVKRPTSQPCNPPLAQLQETCTAQSLPAPVEKGGSDREPMPELIESHTQLKEALQHQCTCSPNSSRASLDQDILASKRHRLLQRLPAAARCQPEKGVLRLKVGYALFVDINQGTPPYCTGTNSNTRAWTAIATPALPPSFSSWSSATFECFTYSMCF